MTKTWRSAGGYPPIFRLEIDGVMCGHVQQNEDGTDYVGVPAVGVGKFFPTMDQAKHYVETCAKERPLARLLKHWGVHETAGAA